MFHSARGVMFPGTEMAPPITRSSFTRRNVDASWEAARARLVKGPMAIMVIVFGGLAARRRRISR